MGGVHKVAIFGHHEANECDTHTVLVEEDVRMGTINEERPFIKCTIIIMFSTSNSTYVYVVQCRDCQHI